MIPSVPSPKKSFYTSFLVSCIVLLFGTAVCANARDSTKPPGAWGDIDPTTNTEPEKTKDFKFLRGLGYGGIKKSATRKKGVISYDRNKAGTGVNLYVSGHAPKAYLINMEGERLHEWRLPWQEAFPNVQLKKLESNHPVKTLRNRTNYWAKAHLYENGDLLAMYPGLGLVKINRHSELIWSVLNRAHHDFAVSNTGKIYCLTRRPTEINDPRKNQTGRKLSIVDEAITVHGSNGDFLSRHSFLDAFVRSEYKHRLDKLTPGSDLFHVNNVDIIEELPNGVPESFKKGDLLVSFNKLDLVGIISLSNNKLKWALRDMSNTQHDPDLLNNGNILFLDNKGPGTNSSSRVVEVDPIKEKIVWKYSHKNFYTECCGTVQRLENNNTLITETMAGRVYEVSRNGEIVWEFINPHRAGVNKQYIGKIFEMKRYRFDYVQNWLKNTR